MSSEWDSYLSRMADNDDEYVDEEPYDSYDEWHDMQLEVIDG